MSSLEGCRGRHFQTKLKLLVKYYVIYIISSTASAVQSGGYERPKCNGSYLEDNYGYAGVDEQRAFLNQGENKTRKKERGFIVSL